jgi:hypothetical protein
VRKPRASESGVTVTLSVTTEAGWLTRTVVESTTVTTSALLVGGV